jgi:hypothetical protein
MQIIHKWLPSRYKTDFSAQDAMLKQRSDIHSPQDAPELVDLHKEMYVSGIEGFSMRSRLECLVIVEAAMGRSMRRP